MTATVESMVSNKEFMARAAQVQSTQEIVDLLAEYGVNVTEEQLIEAVEAAEAEFGESMELDEEALETVAGGRYSSSYRSSRSTNSFQNWANAAMTKAGKAVWNFFFGGIIGR